MSFTEGFAAIEKIKESGQRLSDTVDRIEVLEKKLDGLLKAQSQLEAMLERVTTIHSSLENSSQELSEQCETFTQQATKLPGQLDMLLERAEKRIAEKHTRITAILHDLPELVEQAIEKRLQARLSDLETRFSDRLRDELKDTRQAMRDAMEVNARSLEGKLDTLARDIIAEMPRTLFGRRGK